MPLCCGDRWEKSSRARARQRLGEIVCPDLYQLTDRLGLPAVSTAQLAVPLTPRVSFGACPWRAAHCRRADSLTALARTTECNTEAAVRCVPCKHLLFFRLF